ncbi:hypothetical protein AF332_11485 [Sporosarcina globispora]|uniref:Uncharacterized protein n=1 Tax=Sporosarcina globispora TaxID=1459 RepID=A0A0M0GD81_SPOGL|nr:hypothetical protein [Sporosarcina globispora]KON87386.1 hypothetical protein AF332_11485 [Sporosarcina globispora]
MKILLIENEIVNFLHVNNIRPALNPSSKMYKIKVEMVNGSAFETLDNYTKGEAEEKILEISALLASSQNEVIIQ